MSTLYLERLLFPCRAHRDTVAPFQLELDHK